MRGSRVAVLSDVDIHSTAPEDISHLNHQGLYWWDAEQIDALTHEQYRALNRAQLEALVGNPNITGDLLQELVASLAPTEHVSKLGILLRGLNNDPLEMSKVNVIADAVISELSVEEAKRALVVLCRNSSNRQFRTFLKAIPFHFIKRIAEHELDNPDQMALNRLDLRVEELQLHNGAELLELERGTDVIDSAFEDLLAGQKPEIRHKETPWNRVDQRLVGELESLLSNGLDDDATLNRLNELLTQVARDIRTRIAHLHALNARMSTLVEYWNGDGLAIYANHAEMMLRVVLPQFSILDQMSKMLIRKSGEKLSEEERKTLLATFDKGCMLAELVEPHIRRGEQYLEQLISEQQFLEGNMDAFLDQLRHETRIGRFTLEVFWRMVQMGDRSEAFALLHGDLMEELVVLHPEFDRSFRILQGMQRYRSRVNDLVTQLKGCVERLPVRELSENLNSQKMQLETQY